MKAMTKIALISASILSVGALTACQENLNSHSMMHGEHYKMPLKQREEMKQMRAQHKELRQQMQKACNGKTIGQTVQVTTSQQNINGTCNIVFKADRKVMKEMKHDFHHHEDEFAHMMHHEEPRMKEMENDFHHHGDEHEEPQMKDMTEEQRAQIKQEFAQKRAERKAQWDAIQRYCAGQTDGKAIQVKMGDKIINGKCVVKFQPEFKAGSNMSAIPSKV